MKSVTRYTLHIGSYAGALVLAGAVTMNVWAQEDGAKLVVEARCNACHQLDKTLLGPPWTAVAALHAARSEEMREVLARKIVFGGGGNWGMVPMVPNQWVSIEDARIMTDWILGLGDAE